MYASSLFTNIWAQKLLALSLAVGSWQNIMICHSFLLLDVNRIFHCDRFLRSKQKTGSGKERKKRQKMSHSLGKRIRFSSFHNFCCCYFCLVLLWHDENKWHTCSVVALLFFRFVAISLLKRSRHFILSFDQSEASLENLVLLPSKRFNKRKKIDISVRSSRPFRLLPFSFRFWHWHWLQRDAYIIRCQPFVAGTVFFFGIDIWLCMCVRLRNIATANNRIDIRSYVNIVNILSFNSTNNSSIEYRKEMANEGKTNRKFFNSLPDKTRARKKKLKLNIFSHKKTSTLFFLFCSFTIK